MSRVAITGIGWVLPLGDEVEQVWSRVLEGESGIAPIQRFSTEGRPSHLGGEVESFQRQRIPAMRRRRMDRLSQMACVSAQQALEHAGIDVQAIVSERSGVVFGTSYGSLEFTDRFFCGLVANGPDQVNPSLFPYTVPNAPASLVAIESGLRGMNTTFCQKEISAELALAYAAESLGLGRADLLLAGGGEELAPFLHEAYGILRILSPRPPHPDEALRPYDRRRNGMILGEGAAMLALEREEDVRKRGGRSLGFLAGWGNAADPVAHVGYEPRGAAIERAAREALERAGLVPADLVQVHGAANGTPDLDRAEALALERLVGAGGVPVTSTRGAMGCLDGGGAIRTALACLAAARGVVPPTAGTTEPDPELPVDVALEARKVEPGPVLVTAASHGGACAALVISPD